MPDMFPHMCPIHLGSIHQTIEGPLTCQWVNNPSHGHVCVCVFPRFEKIRSKNQTPECIQKFLDVDSDWRSQVNVRRPGKSGSWHCENGSKHCCFTKENIEDQVCHVMPCVCSGDVHVERLPMVSMRDGDIDILGVQIQQKL